MAGANGEEGACQQANSSGAAVVEGVDEGRYWQPAQQEHPDRQGEKESEPGDPQGPAQEVVHQCKDSNRWQRNEEVSGEPGDCEKGLLDGKDWREEHRFHHANAPIELVADSGKENGKERVQAYLPAARETT